MLSPMTRNTGSPGSALEPSATQRFLALFQERLRRFWSNRPAKVRRLTRRALDLWRREGVRGLAVRSYRRLLPPHPEAQIADILLVCEAPSMAGRATVFGRLSIQGWSLASTGIERVEIYLDDQLLGTAVYGRLREDVQLRHPDYPESSRGGFGFDWDTRQVDDGEHTLVIRALTQDQRSRMIGARILVDNGTTRPDDYSRWRALFEPRELAEAQRCAASLPYRPLFSIVMPVYNTDRRLLERAVASLREQAYTHWQLCIGDDCSTNPQTLEFLAAAAHQDSRIKVSRGTQNGGIAAASNLALALAEGEYIALMDSDDEVPAHALYQVAKLLNKHPEADLIYSDEDKMNVGGGRYEPFFKPDWSPDFLLSCNYLCHFTVLRSALVQAIGGFRSEYDGSQDYDLFLRASERTQAIYHIPKILYHWRAVPTSTASNPQVRMTAHTAAQRALTEHLARKGIDAEVQPAFQIGRWRIKYRISRPADVALLVPSAKAKLVEQWMDGLLGKTAYRHFEILLIDNSKDAALEAVFTRLRTLWPRSQYLDFRHHPFNFSYLNNQAVARTQAPLLLFLNDDTEPCHAEWLEALVEQALRPEVGAVGAKLVYPDNTIQHAGVVMGIHALSAHPFRYQPGDERAGIYFDTPNVIHNCSAVTGACLMTRRAVFQEVGGFEDIHLPVAFQDVDLCLRIQEKGYRVIYTPHAKLYHYESKSKTQEELVPHPYEVRYMQRRWPRVMAHDPYYNPNLTRQRNDCGIALPF
jgi:GT2 family glycosyltransferase